MSIAINSPQQLRFQAATGCVCGMPVLPKVGLCGKRLTVGAGAERDCDASHNAPLFAEITPQEPVNIYPSTQVLTR